MKEDGTHLAFRERDVKLGCKRLLDYCKIIRGRQVQDAADWIESLARMKSEPVLKLLKKIQEDCVEKHKWDLARTYIFDAQPQRGAFVKSLKKHAKANFGVVKSPRNTLMIRVRQVPLEEFFHMTYIRGKVPRSLAGDMRLALHQNRVSTQMQKEWGPYVCARSRFFHRKTLKWMDSTRQFDYYKARHEWITRYRANLLRGTVEAREARGLPPMPVAD